MPKTKTSNVGVVKVDGQLLRQQITQDHVTPHWVRFGEGWMDFQATGHAGPKWVSLDITEHSTDTKSSKRTMVTFDETEVRALRAFLNRVLGD